MPLRFTLRQIEYFVAVAETGGVARAAERIKVSSPSISAAVAHLEQEFGVQLFVRHHAQGLSLTPGGRGFLKQAKALLSEADRLHQVAGDIAESPRGPLSFGCLVTIAPLMQALLRRSFERSYPEARISQSATNQTRLIEMLRSAAIDIALTYDLQIPEDIQFEPLAALPPYVLVAGGHRFAQVGSVRFEELAGEPMVLLDLPLSREYFMSIFHAQGIRPRIVERTSEAPILMSLVANGYGYALLNIRPRFNRAPDGGEVAAVRLLGEHRAMALGLATMRSEHEAGIVKAFRRHCREAISDKHIPGMAPPI